MAYTLAVAVSAFISYMVLGNMIAPMFILLCLSLYQAGTAAVGGADMRRARLKQAGVLLLVLPAILAVASLDSKYAKKQIAVIADASERYKADNGKYPAELSELTPKYLDRLPGIRLAGGMWARPFYYQGKIGAIGEPGYPAAAYDLASKKWTAIAPLLILNGK